MISPTEIIGENYLERWHLLPNNRYLNVYVHKFSGSDDERALHDHPWHSLSVLLSGQLDEIYAKDASIDLPLKPERQRARKIRRFLPVFRRAAHAHRLVLTKGPAWTLFVTGPKLREWGFHCPKGWQHWTTMASVDGKTIGGCGGDR